MKSIYFIGECMVELQRGAGAMRYRFGGDTLNAAVYFSRMADHTLFDPAYVSAIGIDSLSEEMAAMWLDERLNIRSVQRLANKLPGIYLIETDERGERSFHFWRSDSAARYWLQAEGAVQVCADLASADAIYLSGISLAILTHADRQSLFEVLAECRAQGGQIIFDNNYRPRLWDSPQAAVQAYQQVLALTDIALLTLDDEDALYGAASPAEVIARTLALGVKEIVIKRGGLSCILHVEGNQYEVAARPVDHVVDTTAAGDSFGAAYIAERLAGKSPVIAAQAGHRVAAAVIGERGAIIPKGAMPG